MDGSLWSLITIVGPILLAAALLWAVLKNRKAGGKANTEAATRNLYEAQDAADKAADEKVQR